MVCEKKKILESKWAGELSRLRAEQKHEYHDWVHRVYDDTQAANTPSYVYVQSCSKFYFLLVVLCNLVVSFHF